MAKTETESEVREKYCFICLKEKSGSLLFNEDLEKEQQLPSIIQFVCGVQILEAGNEGAVVCNECCVAFIQAREIIRTFRKSQDILRQRHKQRRMVEGSNKKYENHQSELLWTHDGLNTDQERATEDLEESHSSDESTNDPLEKNQIDDNQHNTESNTILNIIRKKTPVGTVLNRNRFRCELCVFESDIAKYFRDHMIKEHNVEKPRIFKCDRCLAAYVEHRTLREHIAHVHESIPCLIKFLCSECGKGFGKHSHLVRHSYVHRPDDRPFRCEYCPMRFVNQSNAKRHMVASHSAIKPYSCDICNKKFGVIYGLRSHLKRVHSAKCHQCPVCHISFRLHRSLVFHLQNGCS